MVHSVTHLTTITSIVQTYVTLPNREQAMVTHIGTIRISPTLTLIDVLCVPSFSFNLISISQLTKTYFCCLIFLGKCWFYLGPSSLEYDWSGYRKQRPILATKCHTTCILFNFCCSTFTFHFFIVVAYSFGSSFFFKYVIVE